jgi:tetratricopeptide (TPR) repeat protein
VGSPPVAAPKKHEDLEALVEWARRALDGDRLVTPPGDNLKDLLDRIEAADPGNVVAAALRARATASLRGRASDLSARHRADEAVDALRALSELDPFDVSVRDKLGSAYAERALKRAAKKQIDGALADGAAAVELLPDEPRVREAFADALFAAGRRDAAADEYRRVLAVAPHDDHARRRLAEAQKPARPKHHR